MLRLILLALFSTLVLSNPVAGVSSNAGNLIPQISNDSIIGDSIDALFISQLSRVDFEAALGRKLTKVERKAFRTTKWKAKRLLANEGRRPGLAVLVIGLLLLLGGLLVAGFTNIAVSICDEDEECAKSYENPKLVGLFVAGGGAFISIISLIGIAFPDKLKSPPKDNTREKWSF